MDNKSLTEMMNVVTEDENTNIVQPFQELLNWCLLISFDLGMPLNENFRKEPNQADCLCMAAATTF